MSITGECSLVDFNYSNRLNYLLTTRDVAAERTLKTSKNNY